MYTYKYIKNIFGVFLLVLLTSNCDGSKHSYNSNSTGNITLAQLKNKLSTGPIFIGENHKFSFARETIEQLIEDGDVKLLFLEIPNMEADDKDLTDYLASVSRVKNKIMEQSILIMIDGLENLTAKESGRDTNTFPLKKLLKIALDKETIAIYFHDASVQGADLAKGQLIDGKYEKFSYGATNEGIKARNKESKKFINPNNLVAGTIILAGQAHLDPVKMGKDGTLQALLGYGDDRMFDLSALTKSLK